MIYKIRRIERHKGNFLSSIEGSANRLPPSSPSSSLRHGNKSPLCSPCCLPPQTCASVNLRHTQRNIFGASPVPQCFSRMDVNEWTCTDGGTVNIYIHCLCLVLSPRKFQPSATPTSSLVILSVLLGRKLHIFSSGLLNPNNIAALAL